MKELNLLTQRLLKEGYDKEHYPKHIRGYNEFYGGFEYKLYYREELTYITPCGLVCKGKSAFGGVYHDGIDWEFENDNPIIICPCYDKCCKCRNKSWDNTDKCSIMITDREWTYDGSVEQKRDIFNKEKQALKEEFMKEHPNVCEQHMKYNPYKREWSFQYDPLICARGYCNVQNTSFKDGALCPVLNKAIGREKGNVYYDVRFEGRDYSKDGTLFEGERFKQIIKDVPLYSKPIPLPIAEVIAKLCREHIEFQVRYNSKWYPVVWMYQAEIGERDLTWSVENIRAEKKVVRDLEADLRDIDEGIMIRHELDERKRRKEEKARKKAENKDKRIKRLENKIIKVGYDELNDSERRSVHKYIEQSRIYELKRLHKEKDNKPTQLTFDFTGGTQ